MHALVDAFRMRYPSVQLVLSTAWTSQNLDQLEAGDVDVAFVRAAVRHRDMGSLVVATEELVAVLPESHHLAGLEDVCFDDVVDLPLVHWPRAQGPAYYDAIRQQIWGNRRQHVVREQPDAEPILREVANGVGIAILDEHRARKLCPPGVCVRRFREAPATELLLAWRSHHTTAVVDRFLEVSREHLNSSAG